MKKIILASILMLALAGLVGCGSEESKEDAEKQAVQSEENYIYETETIYVVKNDEGEVVEYLTEEHPEIMTLKKLADSYGDAIFDFNYEEEFDAEKRISLWVDTERTAQLVRFEESAKNYIAAQVISHYDGIYKFVEIALNENMLKAEITYVSRVYFSNMGEKFAMQSGFELNKVYGSDRVLKVVKVKGNDWKIYDELSDDMYLNIE